VGAEMKPDPELTQRLVESLEWMIMTLTFQKINATGHDEDSPEMSEARTLCEALKTGTVAAGYLKDLT
jgi:hypothetical protein